MSDKARNVKPNVAPKVPRPKAIAREARFRLTESLQHIKDPEGPFLDDACEDIRYAMDLLKALNP